MFIISIYIFFCTSFLFKKFDYMIPSLGDDIDGMTAANDRNVIDVLFSQKLAVHRFIGPGID